MDFKALNLPAALSRALIPLPGSTFIFPPAPVLGAAGDERPGQTRLFSPFPLLCWILVGQNIPCLCPWASRERLPLTEPRRADFPYKPLFLSVPSPVLGWVLSRLSGFIFLLGERSWERNDQTRGRTHQVVPPAPGWRRSLVPVLPCWQHFPAVLPVFSCAHSHAFPSLLTARGLTPTPPMLSFPPSLPPRRLSLEEAPDGSPSLPEEAPGGSPSLPLWAEVDFPS